MNKYVQDEQAIFVAALEQVTGPERDAYVREACAGQPDLLNRIRQLLIVHDQSVGPLDVPPPGLSVDATIDQSLDFLTPSDQPGSLGRLGHYEVQDVIGRGGMGIVLRAFDEKLHRVVAIKVMTSPLATNEHGRRRFVLEGRAAAAIRDDHVIGIHGVDEARGLPFLVMEYVVGRSLAQRIEAEGALPLADTLRIGSQVARGLAAAHAQGLVHRDIKPANILLENGVERVKITDFGLAHAVDDVRTTQPGLVIGTPEYMSPEQARGEKVDHRSDLFSLGCVLYAMCAGRPPFRADSTVAILRRICEDTPRPLSEINSEIPGWLADVIDKLISKDASERFQSAAEVADLLSQFLAHVQQPSVIPLPTPLERPRPARRLTASAGRRRWKVAAAAVLLLCAGLSLAESTGVTHVTATVIRIVRGDGTLVVEVDDPNIRVLVDGEELVITGAGPKEFRLRPGQHELQTAKNGKPLETKLVTITRDGREVVKVAREQATVAGQVSPVTRLVWADAADNTGDISPDGSTLAFTDLDTGNLALRDLATGKNRHLTNKGTSAESIAFAFGPKFSPDGTQLAYTWYDTRQGPATSRSFGELRVIRVEGGDPRVVCSDAGPEPVVGGWTPDGKAILAKLRLAKEPRNAAATTPVDSPVEQFALIATENGSVRAIKSLESRRVEPGHFSLSPDGRTIVYSWITQPGGAHHDIFLIDVETGQETQVTAHAADKTILAWTPDGRRLLFDMDRQGARDAWMIRIAGGKPQGEAELVKKDLGTIVPHGFTHDGTFYFGTTIREPSLFTATLDLEKGAATATPLAAEKFNITDQFGLGDWSPDGEQLAYWARSRESKEIRIVSTKTGQVRVLKPNLNIWRRFRWSPDERSFLATLAALRQKAGIYQIDAVSGQSTVVVEDPLISQFVWLPDGQGIIFSRTPYLLGVPNFLARNIPIVFRDLKTKAERNVLTPGDPDFDGKLDSWFEPSPDGRQLALLGEPNADSMALWLIPMDGGTSRELLKVNTPGTFAGGVGWTPDGRFILFIQLGGNAAQRGLWYIAANGGQPRKVALTGIDARNVTRLAVHPDGKQLALYAAENKKSEVWALENFLPPLNDSDAATTDAPHHQPALDNPR